MTLKQDQVLRERHLKAKATKAERERLAAEKLTAQIKRERLLKKEKDLADAEALLSHLRAKPSRLPRILVIDIETAPIEAYVWGLFDQNIGLEQIKRDSSIISFAAKWVGDPKMVYADTSGHGPERIRDDKPLMKPLWNLLNEADIVVAQNGQAFDTKRINARLITHKMPPYSPVRQVDTLLTARRVFKFTSNKLEWIAAQLTDVKKSLHHKFPGFSLWAECLKDNPAAWAEMKRYNLLDVVACEKVYFRQLPWNDRHPNVSTYDWSKITTCPRCSSDKLEPADYRILQVGIYAQYRCKACGAWSKGKKMLNDTDTRRAKISS